MGSFCFKESKLTEKIFVPKKMWNVSYLPENIERKKYTKEDKVLVIDGDILAYKVAAACEKRSITVTNSKGKTKSFKTRTKFKEWCEDKGKTYSDYSIEDVQTPESIDYCLGTLKRALANLIKRTDATHVEIYVEGAGNFRKGLPLISPYKDRHDSIRPVYLSECKDYLLQVKDAIKVKGRETDDFFQQRLYELKQEGINSLGYTNDKDAKQEWRYAITLYNPDTDEINTYKGGAGELWNTSNGIKGSGLVWLIFQNMLYDKIDNYCMNQFYKKNYGEKSFYKDFKDLKTEKEVLQLAVDKWKKLLPESVEFVDCFGKEQKHNWLSLAELYFSCCYMRIYDNDETTLESLLKEYGVDY